MKSTNPKVVQIQDTTNIYAPQPSPLEELTQYSITGQSKKLREQMLADQFILKNIVILHF